MSSSSESDVNAKAPRRRVKSRQEIAEDMPRYLLLGVFYLGALGVLAFNNSWIGWT
jgi:hypothetical protein